MRKRAALAAAWLFFGLTVSLAVAWGCAIAQRAERALRSGALNDGTDDWSGSFYIGFGVEHYEMFRVDELDTAPPLEPGRSGPRALPSWARRGLSNPGVRQAGRFASGWPLRCMVAGIESVYDERAARKSWSHWGLVRLGLTTRTVKGDTTLAFDDKLPTRPLWDGLVCSTLVFAASGWGLMTASLAIPRLIRRAIRRAGRCRECGYDIRGVPAVDGVVRCPECGQPATR